MARIEAERREAELATADGWVIIHHRATDSLFFGPFKTLTEASEFAADNNIGLNARPMWRDVDWNRRA